MQLPTSPRLAYRTAAYMDSAGFERVLEALRIARGSHVWERTRVLLTEAQLVA
jgi:hypothetical protein